jgi:hypothetical protein
VVGDSELEDGEANEARAMLSSVYKLGAGVWGIEQESLSDRENLVNDWKIGNDIFGPVCCLVTNKPDMSICLPFEMSFP